MRKFQLFFFTILFMLLLNSCKHSPESKVNKPQQAEEQGAVYEIKDISNLKIVSEDSCIKLFWDKLETDGLDKILIEYDDGSNHKTIELDKEQTFWSIS